ncbi:MAG: AAA family ATPase [Clostridia bacterium]|nr:AAA family ATPase [Clostridia bacterium]
MKLIRCHIDNFGGLSDYSLEVDEGLTTIMEANGFGKTTLAEFIRAMFYGFPKARGTIEKNKRKKYLPWQGGRCGGNLVFEYEGDVFRIERTFGATPKGDKFALYDERTNLKCEKYCENIGDEIFGLDADSFERSVYMPQVRDGETFKTPNIEAKLTDLVEDANDINNFDNAIAALEKKRKELKLFRGEGGSVAEVQGKISQLESELSECGDPFSDLEAINRRIAAFEEEKCADEAKLEEVRGRITRAAEATARKAAAKQYGKLKEESRTLRERCAEYDVKFPHGVPKEAEIEAIEPLFDEAAALRGQEREAGDCAAAKKIIEKEEHRFGKGVPDDEFINECRKKQNELTEIEGEKKAYVLSEDEMRRLSEGKRVFVDGVPTDAEIAEKERELIRIGELKAAPASDARSEKTKKSRLPFILAAVGIAAAIGGVALLINRLYIAGALLDALGVLLFILAAYLGVNAAISRDKADGARSAENEREIEALERKLYEFAAKYEARDVREVREKRDTYLKLKEKRARLETLQNEAAAAAKWLKERFAPYFGEEADNTIGLSERLKEERDAYQRAKEAVEKLDRESAQRAKRLDEAREKVRQFNEKYAVSIDLDARGTLNALRSDVREGERTKREFEAKLAETEKFYAENKDAVENAQGENEDNLEALKENEGELHDKISALESEKNRELQAANELRKKADEIPRKRDELEGLKERLSKELRDVETLDKTKAFLEEARQSLSERYLDSVRKSFDGYIASLSGSSERVLMDSEMNVCIDRGGASRELGFFSVGQTDIVMICMRLALSDALFKDVKPFIILDDPFVNLDDEHTREALALLGKLAEERQIIYLVCNTSRASVPLEPYSRVGMAEKN